MKVKEETFDELNGQPITQFTIVNDHGLEISFIDYGCIVTKIIAPDRKGKRENIVLGFDTISDYMTHSPYFGAVVGRVAGRIKNGEFELDGQTYHLEKNDGNNHLHGGPKGFSEVMWHANLFKSNTEAGVEFTYTSSDGEEGYPGTVDVKVTYLINNHNELKVTYEGVSDRTTLINLTNHTYFNLSGHLKHDVLEHMLTLKSNQFLELNQELLPTGKLLSVADTPFDFQNGRKLQDGVTSSHEQNKLVGGGYDHPFLLSENNQEEIRLVDEESGRKVTIETDAPCVVLYTSNMLDGDFDIRGAQARKYLGVCLETQLPPDAIHHPQLASIILEKDHVYHTQTTYRFGTN